MVKIPYSLALSIKLEVQALCDVDAVETLGERVVAVLAVLVQNSIGETRAVSRVVCGDTTWSILHAILIGTYQ